MCVVPDVNITAEKIDNKKSYNDLEKTLRVNLACAIDNSKISESVDKMVEELIEGLEAEVQGRILERYAEMAEDMQRNHFQRCIRQIEDEVVERVEDFLESLFPDGKLTSPEEMAHQIVAYLAHSPESESKRFRDEIKRLGGI